MLRNRLLYQRQKIGKDSGGGVLTSVIIGEAEYSSYGKEAGTKTRQRVIEAVGNRATGRNHY
jgi:hypothetical protein